MYCIIYTNGNKFSMDILNRIDNLRKERGWSMYELATESGLTLSTIANMFSRKTQPSIKTLYALCEAFDMSLSQFFDEDNQQIFLSTDEIELIKNFRKLSKKDKNAITSLLKNLI